MQHAVDVVVYAVDSRLDHSSDSYYSHDSVLVGNLGAIKSYERGSSPGCSARREKRRPASSVAVISHQFLWSRSLAGLRDGGEDEEEEDGDVDDDDDVDDDSNAFCILLRVWWLIRFEKLVRVRAETTPGGGGEFMTAEEMIWYVNNSSSSFGSRGRVAP